MYFLLSYLLFSLSKNLIIKMNTNESSNSSSSKNSLQQKKLDYFGITNNFVQGKGKSTASNTGETVALMYQFKCGNFVS